MPRRPAVRRDADGAYRVAPDWVSLTERLIREAQEAGAFDDLPGSGHPLVLDHDPREGDMGLAFHILRNAHAVPPWIAADRDVRDQAERIERLLELAAEAGRAGIVGRIARARFRQRLDQAIEEHTRAVEALEATAPSVALHRRRLDAAATRQRLHRALDGGPDVGP